MRQNPSRNPPQPLPKSFPTPLKSSQNPTQKPPRPLLKTIANTSMKKRAPKTTQEAPRASQECPEGLQEVPKSAPGGSKRASRDPKSRPRGLYNSKDGLLRCPATECKAGMPKASGRAAVSPQRGRQSASTRRAGACPDGFRNLLRILVRILRAQRVQPGPAQSAKCTS